MTTPSTIDVHREAPDPHGLSIETVTPELARLWLDTNSGNRQLRSTVVDRYARDMSAGAWALTGAPIVFDDQGFLIDGQHRLTACVQSQVPFRTAVMRGASPESHSAIDVGLRRSLRDELSWRGEPNATDLAAAIRLDHRWAHGLIVGGTGYAASTHELLIWLDQNPGLRHAAREAGRHRRYLKALPASVLAPFIYRVEEGSRNADLLEVFLLGVRDGENLTKVDAIWHLRRAIQEWIATKHATVHATTRLALLVKAWNSDLADQPMRLLMWRRTGPTKEPFPVLQREDGTTWPTMQGGGDE